MRIPVIATVLLIALSSQSGADEATDALAEKLKKLDLSLFVTPDSTYVYDGLRAANRNSSERWNEIKSLDDWKKFRTTQLMYLRSSLQVSHDRPQVNIHIAGELAGDGYKIQKLIYETRPGWFVTANLYLPAKPRDKMPGMLLSHSHHSPKSQGELQDMGATWARAGCVVLVPDHLGHGERRQHPFTSAADYEKEFQVGRQDYYFRYDTSLQLYLAGESLMGWLAHDLMGGVDVLLAQEGIAKDQITLLGGVAGGGDPAAVTAALDERIACAVPFNFGGPQPETRYPLPEDAETSFHYAGGGSWESTRNLADSAGDGFLPWVIVGSIAPRRLIYGHEFAWDRERDPVFKRFEKIWSLYDARDNLGFAHGAGTLRGNQPTDTNCGNIGAFHRKMIHPLLDKWFQVGVAEKDEFSAKRDAKELYCWTDELREKLKPKMLHEVLAEKAQTTLGQKPPRRSIKLAQWQGQFRHTENGPLDLDETKVTPLSDDPPTFAVVIPDDQEPDVTLVLIKPAKAPKAPAPLIVAVGTGGAAQFLKHRADEIAKYVQGGAAVALVSVRECEHRDRGQYSELTSISASHLMLGRPLISSQVHDLRNALHYLRSRDDIDSKRIALWGESFAEPLAAEAKFNYPRRIDRPEESDPLGAHLALFTALLEPDIKAVYARGGLVSFASVLESPFVQMPHAAVVRDVFTVGDLPAVVEAIGKEKVLQVRRVDGRNRLVPSDVDGTSPAAWLLERLK